MTPPLHPCDACKGTGQRPWGKCRPCGGRGGFKSSPEQRAKAKERRDALRIAGARQENMNKSCFLGVMNKSRNSPLFVQMRIDHENGRQWSPSQISTARERLRESAEANRILPAFNAERASK